MSFSVGSLVEARGREWIVLPGSDDRLVRVRPLGGSDEETTGIDLGVETVEPAQFELPDPANVGDHRYSRLLRDAVRLSSRAAVGPFRSFGRIAVDPRPYQLVPLLLGLKLDPVRLLIADDVGIGKTIEACLIGRELLDRGEIQRLAVLCPPHLAEQWQTELKEKFHIDAELVLPSTVGRLERNRHLGLGQSIFDVYPYVVVSMDYIKSDRRRDEFVRTCPEFVIVDEAHTCAFGYEQRGGRHQRHELVKQLVAHPDRHMVFVTATPHSGKEASFRSLLSFLNPEFADLPEDLTGPQNEYHRRHLAQYFVQRRRADIRHYMKTDTSFPDREEAEATYQLSPDYKALFDRVLDYARETVQDPEGGQHRKRVRWWSALALLRSLGSSPAAAASTLRNRAPVADAETLDEIDEIGRETVLDAATEDATEGVDVAPGGNPGDDESENVRRRLLEMARQAEQLEGDGDNKLQEAVKLVKSFLKDDYHPILFCRYIPTVEYVARELRQRLPNDVEVAAVTGNLPPADREARVLELSQSPKRVLVCTDCLSEGINLQTYFDAVMHYDLSWSPTRHEQREGRVDRFGQERSPVRVLTFYSVNNQIDGIVLDVLINKHKTIRSSTGVSVPIPIDTNAVVEAIFEGLLLREQGGTPVDQLLPGLDEYLAPKKDELHSEWEDAANREKRSRTMFAQESIKADEVAQWLQEMRRALGTPDVVRNFMVDAWRAHGAAATVESDDHVRFEIQEMPRALKDALQLRDVESLRASFASSSSDADVYLQRTHPVVENTASYLIDTALDEHADGIARRAGAIRTRSVETRITLLLLRFRYEIQTKLRDGTERQQLAEESQLLAFQGAPDKAVWLAPADAEELLSASPDANIAPELAESFVRRVVEGIDDLQPHLEATIKQRAQDLLESHRHVRASADMRHVSYKVDPKLPPDVLGIYVFLPIQGEVSS